MAKHLSVILKQYSDVISGKLPAAKVSALTTGKDPGVDYAGKMPDEREFVASHSVEKHADRNGNGDDLFNAANIKLAEIGRHGHLPKPKDIKTYQQANEEVDLSKVVMDKKTGKLKTSDPKIDLSKVVMDKKTGKLSYNEAYDDNEEKDEGEYGYEGDMAITQLKTICRHAEHLMKMLKPDTDLPEWVQSKITKAEDYISTAHDYLMSEMTEAYKCNMSEAGTMCEVHGTKACPTEEDESASDKEPRYNGKDKAGKRKLLTDKNLQEKAESIAQQKLMAMALAFKRGEMKDASPEVKKLAKSMTEKQLRDYAKTKHEGLPKHVQKESAPASTPITFPVTNSREGFKL